MKITDKMRLDWLTRCNPVSLNWTTALNFYYQGGKPMRQAIDAAIRAARKSKPGRGKR